MPSPRDLREDPADCPFRAEPCPRGNLQAMQCQFRVAQDFDPIRRFNDYEVISCAVRHREIHMVRPEAIKFADESF